MLSGLVLIAANWCSDTSRRMCSVCIMASTEGIVKCFSVKAPFDYQGTPCSVVADKGTELHRGSLFHSEKPGELKEHKEHVFGFVCPPRSVSTPVVSCLSV